MLLLLVEYAKQGQSKTWKECSQARTIHPKRSWMQYPVRRVHYLSKLVASYMIKWRIVTEAIWRALYLLPIGGGVLLLMALFMNRGRFFGETVAVGAWLNRFALIRYLDLPCQKFWDTLSIINENLFYNDSFHHARFETILIMPRCSLINCRASARVHVAHWLRLI